MSTRISSILPGSVALTLIAWPFVVIPLWTNTHQGDDMEGFQFAYPAIFSWILAFFIAASGIVFLLRFSPKMTAFQRRLGVVLCIAVLCAQALVICYGILKRHNI
jgi:hypothetical protein